MNAIAVSVGIRKASLYSHVVGKDELFLTSLDLALQAETAFAQGCFESRAPQEGAGFAYIAHIADRYTASPSLRFILRAAYLLPKSIGREIGVKYEGFLDLLRASYLQQVEALREELTASDRAYLQEAYVGIVESLFVELTYGTTAKMVSRRDALWRMFSEAAKKEPGPQ